MIQNKLQVQCTGESRQIVYLYPDGEVRYSSSLYKREKKEVFKNGAKLIQLNSVINESNKIDVEKTKKLNTEKITDSVFNSIKEKNKGIKPGWGVLAEDRKFTKNARNTTRRIAAALELEFGKERLAFCTLTVPGSTHRAIRIVAENSGYIMNRIQTYLTDNYTHKDGKKYVMGVVELQKRGMLHWHFLVVLPEGKSIDKLESDLQKFWFRMLNKLGDKNNCDLFKRSKGNSWKYRYGKIKHRAVDVEEVRKSAANYLSKYISKNYKSESKGFNNISYCPSRWWSKSDDCVDLMHKYTKVYQLPLVSELIVDNLIIPHIEDFLLLATDWVVVPYDKYHKRNYGVVGRGQYQQCSEVIDQLVKEVEEMTYEFNEENRNYSKNYHSAYFKAVKKRQEEREEVWERSVRDKQKHKAYWYWIEERGLNAKEAFKIVYGEKNFDSEKIEASKVASRTRMVYDRVSGSLIEVPVNDSA